MTKALPAVLALLLTAVVAAPAAAADQPWMDATKPPAERASAFVAALSLEEEVAIMHGIGQETGKGFIGQHTGAIPPIGRVAFPGLHATDGPLGVRQHAPATALPSGPALAATWDPELARRYGVVLGRESRDFNNDIVFGPMVNMVRLEGAGRNFEGFGEDPILAGALAVAQIDGIQSQGVLADVKHFAANSFEANRMSVDEKISDRTLHELYLPAFEAAVKQGHVATVMAGYNKVNGLYMAENCPLTQGVLRDEWGFDGFVVSDYDSTHGSVPDVRCGTDIEFPTGQNYEKLVDDVKAGRIDKALIDRSVERIARTMFRFGLFDRAACADVDRCGPIDVDAGRQTARDIATAGAVLLKNERATLPLDPAASKTIAVVGPAAAKVNAGGGSSQVQPATTVTPVDGITARAARSGVTVITDPTNTVAGAAAAAARADVAIVVAGDSLTEANDRLCLQMTCPGNFDAEPDADLTVAAVAAANPRTVAVVQSGEPDVFPWLGQVPAVLEAWFNGEADGDALGALLFGDANPSGRLPASFPVRQSDTAVQPSPQYQPSAPLVSLPGATADYREGVFTGYRHYDKKQITPQFAFGHGLSYTSFRLADLSVERSGAEAVARFSVTNSGARAGADTPQLYVGAPKDNPLDEPVRQLKGFTKVTLAPGATRRVALPIDLRAISYWNSGRKAWAQQPSCHPVLVAESAADVRLDGPTVGPPGLGCTVAITAACADRRVRLHVKVKARSRVVRIVVRRGGKVVAVRRGKDLHSVVVKAAGAVRRTYRITATTRRGHAIHGVRRISGC